MSDKIRQFIPWAAALIMIVAIVAGLIAIGGPAKARAETNDARRLIAVKDTAQAIACYRYNLGEMPEDLETLIAEIDKPASTISRSGNCSRLKVRSDPITTQPFDFRPRDEDSFEICAEFDRPSHTISDIDVGYTPAAVQRYQDVLADTHKPRPNAGRHCYMAQGWIERWRDD